VNEWGALFWLSSVVFVLSLPFVFLAILMRLVGRIRTPTPILILAADAILGVMASCFWSRSSYAQPPGVNPGGVVSYLR